MGEQGTHFLLLLELFAGDFLEVIGPESVQVGVLGAHEDEVAALAPRQVIPLAHHEGHVVEFVDFERVQDQINEVLVYIVHLDYEISFINGLILIMLVDFMQDAFFLESGKLLSHIIRPQAEVVDDLLSDHVLHIIVIIVAVDKADLGDLLLVLIIAAAEDRRHNTLNVGRRDYRKLRCLT